MGQYGINVLPIAQLKIPLKYGEKRGDRTKNQIPRFICCLSGESLAATNDELVSYIHHDGQRIDFSYICLLDMIGRQEETYFRLPYRRAKDFDIVDFLNQTRKKITKATAQGKIDPAKLEKTIIAATEILDATGLNRFIAGGSSAFITEGLIISEFPKTGTNG
ncbi:MAG: hypothetical protein WC453_04220 [Patescibacteria group bacterium]